VLVAGMPVHASPGTPSTLPDIHPFLILPSPLPQIVSILFFEMSLGAALWTGLLAGFAYSIMVRLMYRQHFYAMRRLAEQQAAARREVEQGAGGPVPHAIVVAV